MALKGTTRIELTNVKTGEREVIEKDNLVTNVLSDLLNLNPMGMRLRAYSNTSNNTNNTSNADMYDELGASFEAGMLPICPNAVGGILLYEDALEEDPDKYYAPMENLLVGYSSNDVNTTTDVRRGSMNQVESGPLEDGSGYRFVFDFETTQANGTIASVGLTSERGGKAGYGAAEDKVGYSMVVVDKYIRKIPGSSAPAGDDMFFVRNNYVAMDPEQNLLYYARLTASNTIIVGKLKIGVNTVGIMKTTQAEPTDIEETIIETNGFGAVSSTTYTHIGTQWAYSFAGTFVDGGDGFIWGFQHKGNALGNTSGIASVLWIKISKADFSFTEGEWNLDAKLFPFGMSAYNNVGIGGYSNKCFWNYTIIQNGRLYALKHDRKGIYSINLSNTTDIKLMECDFEIYVSKSSSPTMFNDRSEADYCHFNTAVIEIGKTISYLNAYISGETVHERGYGTTNSAYPNSSVMVSKNNAMRCNPLTRAHYGPFFLNYYAYCRGDGRYGYPVIWLMTPYLATINNLSTPVQKTADKTMKITYILREES